MIDGKTTAVKKEEIVRNWHFINADGKILGRLASEIAKILTGKNKASYSTNENVGDKVVVTNAEKIKVTGKKVTDKIYYWYTGYPGGLRSQSLRERSEKTPTKALLGAISGMLPKNKLRKERIANLYIYAGEEHPHKAHEKKGNK